MSEFKKFNSTEERNGSTIKLNFGNSLVYKDGEHFQTEEVEGLVIESYQQSVKELLEALNYDTNKYSLEYLMEQTGFKREGISLNEEASTVEMPVNVSTNAEVKSDGEKVTIEINIEKGEVAEFDDAGSAAGEAIVSESFRVIYGTLSSESSLPDNVEATIFREGNKIIFELPIIVERAELSEAQSEILREQTTILSNLFNKGLKFEHMYTREDFLQDSLLENFISMEDSEATSVVSKLKDGSLLILNDLLESYSLGEIQSLLEATPSPTPTPTPKKGNLFDYISNQAKKFTIDPLRRFGNYAVTQGKRFGNALSGVIPDTLGKIKNFGNRVGNNIAVRLAYGAPQIIPGIQRFFSGLGSNQAADKGMGFTKADQDLMSGKAIKTKKQQLGSDEQTRITNEILQKRKDLQTRLAGVDKKTMTVADYEQLKKDSRDANNQGGGVFGNILKTFNKGKIPQFLLSKSQKQQVTDAVQKNPDVATMVTNQNNLLQLRNNERQRVRNLRTQPFTDKINTLQTQKQAGITRNVDANTAANQAIDNERRTIDQGIVTQGNAVDATIRNERETELERIRKDVGIKEETLFLSLEEANSLFESLNLDTEKYTTDYLAEQFGMIKVENLSENYKEVLEKIWDGTKWVFKKILVPVGVGYLAARGVGDALGYGNLGSLAALGTGLAGVGVAGYNVAKDRAEKAEKEALIQKTKLDNTMENLGKVADIFSKFQQPQQIPVVTPTPSNEPTKLIGDREVIMKKLEEGSPVSTRELRVLFEGLNLDTEKYTVEYLAEQLGFVKGKK